MTPIEPVIAGEPVELSAVVPSADELASDAKGRIGNTALQAVVPTALMTIATWTLALAHVDLDPGAGSDMPAVVSSAFTSLLTVAIAWRMNRKALRAVVTELHDLRSFVDEIRELGDAA